MPTVLDVSTVIASALSKIGVDGRLDVRMNGSRSTCWMGSPTGDDVEVTISVLPLADADRAVEHG